MISQPQQNIAAIFKSSNYYYEKIIGASLEPTVDHTAMAKIGISSLLELVNKFQSALEARNRHDLIEEWLMDIDDLRYSLRHLESAFLAEIQLSAQQQRLSAYSMRYLLNKIVSFAESLDRDS